MSKATKGPWEITSRYESGKIPIEYDPDGVSTIIADVIYRVEEHFNFVSDDEALANAKLIVNAVNEREELLNQKTEMLELLKEHEFDSYISMRYGKDQSCHTCEMKFSVCPECGKHEEEGHDSDCPYHADNWLGKLLDENKLDNQ